MSNDASKKHHGGFSLKVQIAAPREKVYAAWTELPHRRNWFMGPGWTEIERSQELRVSGTERIHGRFGNGMETLYKAYFHHVEHNARLIYAFDMQVDGRPVSVSLAEVEFRPQGPGTELTYTEHTFFLSGSYDADSRVAGTQGLLGEFSAYVEALE